MYLNDKNGKSLDIWHLNLTHGLHTHQLVKAKKQDAHIPITGTLVDVARMIADKIKAGLR